MKNDPPPDRGLIGQAFARADWQGRVHSVFGRAVNLAGPDSLVTLISEPLWISESAALARPASLARASVGALVSFTDRQLWLEGRLLEDYRQARLWRMPELTGDLQPGRLLALGQELEKIPRPPLGAAVESRFLEAASAFARGDRADFTALIGAGPGLTPSGDDLLCGFALALACQAPARLPELAAVCWPALERTTDVSRHLLQEALRGSFGWPLLGLLLALQGRAEFGPALELALSIGASSGRDGAAGLYHGLVLV